MLKVRYVSKEDASFWFKLDKHLTKEEYNKKVSFFSGNIILQIIRHLSSKSSSNIINPTASSSFKLDKHLTKEEYNKKVDDKRGYVLLKEDIPIGVLRYNLFWDNIPFCTLIYIDLNYQHNGYGKYLMENWERDMKSLGYGMVMTSTQVDE